MGEMGPEIVDLGLGTWDLGHETTSKVEEMRRRSKINSYGSDKMSHVG